MYVCIHLKLFTEHKIYETCTLHVIMHVSINSFKGIDLVCFVSDNRITDLFIVVALQCSCSFISENYKI